MITKTILTSGLLAMALAISLGASATAQTNTVEAQNAQVHLAGFKHFRKHQRIGRHGRFLNRGFRTRHFGHRGFYRGSELGYYPGLRKERLKKHGHKHHGAVTDRYGNPIKLFNGGVLQSK